MRRRLLAAGFALTLAGVAFGSAPAFAASDCAGCLITEKTATSSVGINMPSPTFALVVQAATDRVLNVRGDPATLGFPSGQLGPILQGTNTAENAEEPITIVGSNIN
jgi:hypothetical protein